MTDKAYSRNEEEFYELSDFLDMLADDDALVPGTMIYEGEQIKRTASDYLYRPVETILENLGEQAFEEAGEFIGDWPDNCLTKEKQAELEGVIAVWLDANLPVSFWTVKNVRKLELTAEWIAENTATQAAAAPGVGVPARSVPAQGGGEG